jgi:LacI family transcriptional regulator
MLAKQSGFTAVFCGDDMIAFSAMAGFKSRRCRIPEDLALLGFMDDPLAGVLNPGLTSIRYPMVEMGERAFEVLFGLLDEPRLTAPHILLETELIVRHSTDPSFPRFADSNLIPSTNPTPNWK